jgi:hypothetical protein
VLVAAAVCPHPPLLIPAATGSQETEAPAAHSDVDISLARLRAACTVAVSRLLAARADQVIVVGADDQSRAYQATAAGSLRPYGIPFSTGTGDPVLPLPLTIGAWLLRTSRSGPPRRLVLQGVARDTATPDCLRLGARLAGAAERVGLLVMGDGPARRAVGVPGVPDPDADAYDNELSAAFASADADRLAVLDPALDKELLVAGRAAWQVLSGAARECRLTGRLLFAGAPLDVSYLAASWDADDPALSD